MNVKLELVLKEMEGALVRTLALIERRGHRLVCCASRPLKGSGRQQLELSVDTRDRSPEVLARQLLRLYDVISVDISRITEIPLESVPMHQIQSRPSLTAVSSAHG